jgi:hypothetical protein
MRIIEILPASFRKYSVFDRAKHLGCQAQLEAIAANQHFATRAPFAFGSEDKCPIRFHYVRPMFGLGTISPKA